MLRFCYSLILSFFAIQQVAHAKSYLSDIFTEKYPIIAALALKTPDNLDDEAAINKLIEYAISQMRILEAENVDGVLWEIKAGGILDPEISEKKLSVMAKIMSAVIKSTSVKVGVEILWHYPEQTLLLAKQSGAKFVRIDFFSDEMSADGKVVPINPEKLIQFKNTIGATDIVLFTDIQVKYAEMLDPQITITQSAQNAINKGSQGVIVSSTKSGEAPSPEKVRDAKIGSGRYDTIIGSGFNHLNARSLLQYADGVIVGTSISEKTGGPLVPAKVHELMLEIIAIRKR